MDEDDRLYRSFLTGDNEAYDELMKVHGDKLVYYLYGIMHDYHDAEDMMIEAFAVIMVKKPKIESGAFAPYLFKTARNLAIRQMTKKKRRSEFLVDDMTADIPSDESIEENEAVKDRNRILHECLGRLNVLIREALYLVYFDGMTYKQAAEIMKVNTKKIDHLLESGKRKLKKELESEGVTDLYI